MSSFFCRVVLEALLTAMEQLKDGSSCWYAAVVPLTRPPRNTCTSSSTAATSLIDATQVSAAATAEAGASDAKETATTAAGGGAAAVAALHASRHGSTTGTTGRLGPGEPGECGSDFSLGSDAQKVEWHRDTALDMQWLGQLVVLLLRGLVRAEQWHQSLALGKGTVCMVLSGAYKLAYCPQQTVSSFIEPVQLLER